MSPIRVTHSPVFFLLCSEQYREHKGKLSRLGCNGESSETGKIHAKGKRLNHGISPSMGVGHLPQNHLPQDQLPQNHLKSC